MPIALKSSSTDSAHETSGVKTKPPRQGSLDPGKYAETYRKALAHAGITDYVRPFHDGRHTSITNAAAAGMPPATVMARAGHSDFSTTQLYIDLAGETFREEADRLEERLFGVRANQG